MALPEFFARVADSLRPVADVDPDALASKLDGVRVRIELVSPEAGARSAFMLACNLAARLYPRIITTSTLAPPQAPLDGADAGTDSDEDVADVARQLILKINPHAQADTDSFAIDEASATRATHPDDEEAAEGPPSAAATSIRDVFVRIGVPQPSSGRADPSSAETEAGVVVDASGWNVIVDPTEPGTDAEAGDQQPGHPLAWLAAAAIGMAEVFRTVFAEELGPKGRTCPQPGGLNLLTTAPVDPGSVPAEAETDLDVSATIDLGEVHLVGAGAIGQAAAYAISHLNATGILHVIDPETITLSNLQRYLLTDASSVSAVKADLVRDALTTPATATPGVNATLEVRPLKGRWGDAQGHLQAEQVLVALDSAGDRITVAATEPQHAYNAWTQVADLGWSRHEDFGTQPCLACLYYPDQARPSEHELIGEALHQPPLRVLAYLTYNLPIGFPLPGIPAIVELPPPPGSDQWTQVGLIEDLIASGVVDPDARNTWSNTTIGALYRDGICAGGLLPVGDLPGDVLVPLAHQSALAGIMVVAELVWSRTPELASQRDALIEHRYDVLRGFPQVVARPRERTLHCLCSDPVFVAAAL
ncbi:hypothetical protein GCM10027596_24190 [Nocardioides korecus]